MANNIPSVLPTSHKYFYFRTVATLANDDATGDSLMMPVSAFIGGQPTSDTAVTLYFEPVIVHDDRGSDTFKNNDTVVVNTDTNKAKEVLKAMLDAVAGKNFQSQGMIVVADDVTETYLEGVATCGAITIAAAAS
tara:strand:+ start:147 stop:551 length:405 start_codon:yes stop_codon:yes gene_type:complete